MLKSDRRYGTKERLSSGSDSGAGASCLYRPHRGSLDELDAAKWLRSTTSHSLFVICAARSSVGIPRTSCRPNENEPRSELYGDGQLYPRIRMGTASAVSVFHPIAW